jgi:hypothetical protein
MYNASLIRLPANHLSIVQYSPGEVALAKLDTTKVQQIQLRLTTQIFNHNIPEIHRLSLTL